MKFYVYELDERQKAISDFLVSCGHIKIEREQLNIADVVVLPFNNVSSNITIDNEYIDVLKNGVKVFTGVHDKSLSEKFKLRNIELTAFMDYKDFAIANSVPTAEGVVFYLLSEMKRTIFGSNALVIGYGICGSEIANKLMQMNANVDILEISNEKIAQAKLNKFKNVELTLLSEKKYDVIINTVPLHVLDKDVLDTIDKNTLIFDIASSPFGFDMEDVKEVGLYYKRILGLPSRFGVAYSGEILGNLIIKHI